MTKQELYLQVAQDQNREQDNRNRDFHTKASWTFSGSAVLVGIGAVVAKDIKIQNISGPDLVAIVAAIVLAVGFFLIAAYTLKAIRPREWKRSPGLNELADHINVPDRDDGVAVKWVADAYRSAVKFNEDVLESKAANITSALWCLAIQVVAISVLTGTRWF